MEATILTPAQQKKTLSKKSTPKKSVRNVLAASSAANKSNTLPEYITTQLCELLTKALSPFRQVKKSLKWTVLKSVPKSERKAYRNKMYKSNGQNKNELKKFITIGVNAVTRSLENRSATSVIISGDADPPIITKHIYDMCLSDKIPIAVMPSLQVLQKTLGFSPLAVAFKSPENKEFLEIENIIKQTFMYISKNVVEVESQEEEVISDANTSDVVEIMDTTETQTSKPKDLYKYRSDSSVRVFRPPPSCDSVTDNLNVNMDFIAFSKEPGPSTYVPVVVRRVSENPKRANNKYKGV